MKWTTIYIFFLCVISIGGFAQKPDCDNLSIVYPYYGQCNTQPWVLVFEDQFNGNTLDRSRWVPDTAVTRDHYFEQTKCWLLPQNIQTNSGTVKLLAQKEPFLGTHVLDWATVPPTANTDFFDYTASEMHSRYQYGYGQYEIRCKIPKGKGFFPAFWTFEGSRWNEIDIFEFKNVGSNANYGGPFDLDRSVKAHQMNSHYDFDSDGGNYGCGLIYQGPDFSQDFHVFTVVWDPYRIDWYMDGILKRRVTKFTTIAGQEVDCMGLIPGAYALKKYYPINEYMNIIADFFIQSGGEAPDLTTPFPSALEIDYIKYYRQMACPGNLNIANVSQLGLITNTNIHDADYNLKLGSTINVSGSINILANQQLELRAGQLVVLSPGFWAKPGSDFVAKTASLMCTQSTELESYPSTEYLLDNDIEVASVVERNKHDSFNIYPNPSADGVFTVEIGGVYSGELRISVKDFMGKEMQTRQKTINGSLLLDISNLAKGVYFLSVFDEKHNLLISQKIISN